MDNYPAGVSDRDINRAFGDEKRCEECGKLVDKCLCGIEHREA